MPSTKLDVPSFSSEKPYERYKFELQAWSATTSTEKAKQGLTVALSLPEDDATNIRDKVFSELDLEELKKDTGLTTLIAYFDTPLHTRGILHLNDVGVRKIRKLTISFCCSNRNIMRV